MDPEEEGGYDEDVNGVGDDEAARRESGRRSGEAAWRMPAAGSLAQGRLIFFPFPSFG